MPSPLPTLRFIATHPLSSRKPLSAFWRYGRWQIESRLRSEVEFSWIEGSKLVARNGMTGATGNIYCGLHEFADMAFVLHLLRPDDLFVDVGANVGSYTVLASAVCAARTIAIEPDPETARSLQRNIAANGIGDRVAIVQAAVGNRPGRTHFTVGNDTTNRVAATASAATREVEMRTLHDILDGEHPLLIKIDVEGSEPEVMAGAGSALDSPGLQAILLETVDDDVRAQLDATGFQQAVYDPTARRLVLADGEGSRSSGNNSLFVRDLEACRRRISRAPIRDILGHRI